MLLRLLSLLLWLRSALSARDIMVVTSTDDASVTSEPRVLEIFDFESGSWRAVEKSDTPSSPGPAYRAESMRPGTARLVEDHAVLQYELRNGLSTELASYPKSIQGATTLEYGDTFCLVGGYNADTRQLRNAVLCWNPLTPGADHPNANANGTDANGNNSRGGWVALPNMKAGRFQPGAVVMDGKLYVAGGYDTDHHLFLSDVEVFDDLTQMWYPVAPLKHPRAGLQLVSVGGKLFAMGGWHNHRYLDTVEEYNPLTNAWTDRAKMPTPRARFGAVARGELVYVVGGRRGFRASDQLRTVEAFSPGKNEWAVADAGELSIISGPVRATIIKEP